MLSKRNVLKDWERSRRRIVIECEGDGALSDQLVLQYYDSNEDWLFENTVEIMQLIAGETFWQRVKHALRHIFCFRRRFTGFTGTLVSADDTMKIIDFLKGFLKCQVTYCRQHDIEYDHTVHRYIDNWDLR